MALNCQFFPPRIKVIFSYKKSSIDGLYENTLESGNTILHTLLRKAILNIEYLLEVLRMVCNVIYYYLLFMRLLSRIKKGGGSLIRTKVQKSNLCPKGTCN